VIIEKKIARTRSESSPTAKARAADSARAPRRPIATDVQVAPSRSRAIAMP
jgi:hypothetical protein